MKHKKSQPAVAKTKQQSLLAFFGKRVVTTKHEPAVAQKVKLQTIGESTKKKRRVSIGTSGRATESPFNHKDDGDRSLTAIAPEQQERSVTLSVNKTDGETPECQTVEQQEPNSKRVDIKNDMESDNENEEVEEESADDDTDAGNTEKENDSSAGEYQLSEYELLRLRNIARNQERLRVLGLLTAADIGNQNAAPKKKRTKRASRTTASVSKASSSALPTRRSTRNRGGTSHTTAALNAGTEDQVPQQDRASAAAENGQMEDHLSRQEVFEVSPLVQYDMNNLNDMSRKNEGIAGGWNIANDATITGLAPTHRRLNPPAGLSAIYTLEYYYSSWLVGAGKAGMVALWTTDANAAPSEEVDENDNEGYLDPIVSWKAHSGRWIAQAHFLPSASSETTTAPSRLLTAANDGAVCLWDLSQCSIATGAPKLVSRTGKDLHASGIFAMHVANEIVCTGSKDKTVALTSVERLQSSTPLWRSDYHSGKVGAVHLRAVDSLVATASDDGSVAIFDHRKAGDDPIAVVDGIHNGRPHSVIWDPWDCHGFLTAGLDDVLHTWDMRVLGKSDGCQTSCPVRSYHGHVPSSTKRCKRIHHPVFYHPGSEDTIETRFALTGGEGSHALSMFQHDIAQSSGSSDVPLRQNRISSSSPKVPVYSRGSFPDAVDASSIAVNNSQVAVSIDGGEVILLSPVCG